LFFAVRSGGIAIAVVLSPDATAPSRTPTWR